MFRNSFFALALALTASLAHAATGSATGQIVPSTTYTDGSPLAAADLQSYTPICSFTPAGATASGACTAANFPSVAGTATTFSGSLTVPAKGGKACFQLTARANGIDSAPSAINATTSCKTFDALPPSAPGPVTITITLAMTISSDTPISVAMADPVISKK